MAINVGVGEERQDGFFWAKSEGAWVIPEIEAGRTWFRMDAFQLAIDGLETTRLEPEQVDLRVSSFHGSPFVIWTFLEEKEESYFRSYAAYGDETPEGRAYIPGSYGISGSHPGHGSYHISLVVHGLRARPVLEYVDIPEPERPSLLDEDPCPSWEGDDLSTPVPPGLTRRV